MNCPLDSVWEDAVIIKGKLIEFPKTFIYFQIIALQSGRRDETIALLLLCDCAPTEHYHLKLHVDRFPGMVTGSWINPPSRLWSI